MWLMITNRTLMETFPFFSKRFYFNGIHKRNRCKTTEKKNFSLDTIKKLLCKTGFQFVLYSLFNFSKLTFLFFCSHLDSNVLTFSLISCVENVKVSH